ncbi:MAG: hypothetical protein JXA50_00465 [Deltaproteobacteria bacterium]|nr:hypothetical protein [Deltaproteobacteria bacterium]
MAEIVPILDLIKEKFSAIVNDRELGEEDVQITIAPLSAREAIGSPKREDYALLEGKEVMIEARFRDSFGQAFTDRPQDFHGPLKDVLNLSLDTKNNRAMFTATLNAVSAHLGLATGVRHCRDEEPETCAEEIAKNLLGRFGKIKIGLVGYQPAILEHLIRDFGVKKVRCMDLNPKNIGSHKFGIEIWSGRTETTKLITWSDLILVTSSSLVNNTFDAIRQEATSQEKHLIIFGVTGAGACALTGVERLCFNAH